MGKYCDICKKTDKELDKMNKHIQEMRTIEIIDDEVYSKHAGHVCEICREDILCYLDKLPTWFDSKWRDYLKNKVKSEIGLRWNEMKQITYFYIGKHHIGWRLKFKIMRWLDTTFNDYSRTNTFAVCLYSLFHKRSGYISTFSI